MNAMMLKEHCSTLSSLVDRFNSGELSQLEALEEIIRTQDKFNSELWIIKNYIVNTNVQDNDDDEPCACGHVGSCPSEDEDEEEEKTSGLIMSQCAPGVYLDYVDNGSSVLRILRCDASEILVKNIHNQEAAYTITKEEVERYCSLNDDEEEIPKVGMLVFCYNQDNGKAIIPQIKEIRGSKLVVCIGNKRKAIPDSPNSEAWFATLLY